MSILIFSIPLVTAVLMPDNFFYGLKTFAEDMTLAINQDPSEKNSLTLNYAAKRLYESRIMFNEEDASAMKKAITGHEKLITSFKEIEFIDNIVIEQALIKHQILLKEFLIYETEVFELRTSLLETKNILSGIQREYLRQYILNRFEFIKTKLTNEQLKLENKFKTSYNLTEEAKNEILAYVFQESGFEKLSKNLSANAYRRAQSEFELMKYNDYVNIDVEIDITKDDFTNVSFDLGLLDVQQISAELVNLSDEDYDKYLKNSEFLLKDAEKSFRKGDYTTSRRLSNEAIEILRFISLFS